MIHNNNNNNNNNNNKNGFTLRSVTSSLLLWMFDFDNSISTFAYKNFSEFFFSSKIAKRQAFPKYSIQYNTNFPITVHILARSLADFYRH